jgi:acetolactate synthase-1/2/3 large subunit
MAKMTGGQAVVESLIAQGVTTVFGIVSVHNLHIFDALRDATEQGRIRFIGGRHEHALVCMADGYARATGTPGVLITSSGPGAADSVGALGESYHSSVPVLEITTDIEHDLVNKGHGSTHEPKDQLGMFSSVSGWQSMAESVADVPNQIAGAMEHLKTQHPRPAVVVIPTDLLGESADVEIIPARELPKAKAEQASVTRAAELLASAKNLVLWGGKGVMTSGASAELVELAELLGAPVVTGDGGKGAIPEDHPLALGSSLGGRLWGKNPLHEYIANCDVALVAGGSLPYRSTTGVGLKLPKQLIQIDIDPAMFGRNYPVEVGLAGDAKAVLRQLLDALSNREPSSSSGHAEAMDLRLKSQASVREQFPNELHMWEAIRGILPRDATIVFDSTMPVYCAERCFPAYEPLTYHLPHGWVSVGYGFAASLGMKAALPNRPVVCVTGDGGFQYNMQELGTAVQYGLAPVVLIFNDNAWGSLKFHQDQSMGGRNFGVHLENPDFRKLAEAYAVDAVRVDNLDQLLWELQRALNGDRIQIIEVVIPNGLSNFR